MPYINIHDGTTHTLNPPSALVLVQTFDIIFSRYLQHPEYKSLAPDDKPCKSGSHGLLKRHPVTACGFHLIGKETERGWEQADDISTLLPSLVRYRDKKISTRRMLQQRLKQISLDTLQRETGLSRHTILHARRGQQVHARTEQLLRRAVYTIAIRRH